MARPQATPEQKAKSRLKIRQAAADIYNAEGPAGISIRAVAQRADVSVGTIYTYFGSLQGLMESLWSGPVAKYSDKLKKVALDNEDPVKRLEALMRAYIEFAFANHEIYRGVFLFVRPLNMQQVEKRPAEEGIFPSILMDAIKDGQRTKQLKPGNAQEIAMMIWAGLHGCIALPNNFSRLEFGDTKPMLERYVKTTISALQA